MSAPAGAAILVIGAVRDERPRLSREFGEEVVLPFSPESASTPKTTQFRSTWVVASRRALQEHGHHERYVELLAGEHKREILESVAGTWLEMRVVRAHYEACDRLGLTSQEQLAMGRAVGDRAQGNLLATAVRLAQGAGVTPWTVFPQFDRLWRRGANGGAVAVVKLGPKEARLDVRGCELFDVPYFRTAFRGVLLGIVGLFCQRVYVHDVTPRAAGTAAFRFQWV